MCWYYSLVSMLVVLSTTVVAIGSVLNKEKPFSENLIFGDCTIEELQYYETIQPVLRKFMTCESNQRHLSVPMVSESNFSSPIASEDKCNNPKSDDIYDILPVYHSSLEINFRNIHCLLENYHIMSVDSKMYHNTLYHRSWRMVVSRECFNANIARVTKKAFSSLLRLLTTSDNCFAMFLPPRMIYTKRNMSHFYKNLHVECLNSSRDTSVRMLQMICKLCAWLFDEYFAACDTWKGTQTMYINLSEVYTNIMLHVVDSQGIIISARSKRCLARGCFDECNDGELGHELDCFHPIEYVDGVMSEVWISHDLHDQESILEVIVTHLYRNVLNATDDIAIRFVNDGKALNKKMDKCTSLKMVFTTKTYVHSDKLRAVLKNVDELLRQGNFKISYRNDQSIIHLHSRPKPCRTEVNYFVQTSEDERIYIFLVASIMCPLMLIVVAASFNFLKKRCSRDM